MHVRDAIPPALIAALHGESCAIFREWTTLATSAALPPELEAPLRRRFIPLEAVPLLAGRIRSLLHPSVLALARDYLEHEPELAENSHVRSITVDRPDAHLPFHQDETILGRRLLNVWIALDACGETLPGLEVIWNSWTRRLTPVPRPGAAFPVEQARLEPVEVFGRFGQASRWAPRFSAGDAMIFSGATIHRTHVRPGMRGERLSVEVRLF